MQHRFFRSATQPGRTLAPRLLLRQLTCLTALMIAAAAGPVSAQNLLFDNVGSSNASHPDRLITVDPGGVPQVINRLGFLTGDNSAGQPVSQIEIRDGVQFNRPGVDAT